MSESHIAIGNQTASAAANFLEPFEYALASGFDAFEWFPDKKPSGAGWDEADLSSRLRAQIKRRARSAGMRLSVHAHWTANPLQTECHPLLLRDLELTSSLGAAVLNIHFYPELGVATYADAIKPLLRRAEASGLKVSIENTPETSPQQFNELFALLRSPSNPALLSAGMCLDLGHANLCAATRNNYLAYLDQLDPGVPIIHLHVHENWGDADTHLPLFTGPAAMDARGIAGFLERLRARRYSGSLILEQWPHPPALLNAARERLLGMLREDRRSAGNLQAPRGTSSCESPFSS